MSKEGEMENQEPKINGVPHRLMDGYDGGETPPQAFMDDLLKNAPPEVQARAKEFALQNQAAANKQAPAD